MRLLLLSLLINFSLSYNTPSKINQLARENFKLVPYFAKPYIKKHNLNKYQKEELIQEGYLGFMMACRKYNDTFNSKLSTYSSFWIKRYMTLYIQNHYKNKEIISLNKIIPLKQSEKPIIKIYFYTQ